jgi:hypothetical protein
LLEIIAEQQQFHLGAACGNIDRTSAIHLDIMVATEVNQQ